MMDKSIRWLTVIVTSSTSEADVDAAIANARLWKYGGVLFDFSRETATSRELVLKTVLATLSMNQQNLQVLFRVAGSEAAGFIEKDIHADANWNAILHLPMEEPLADSLTVIARAKGNVELSIRLLKECSFEVLERVFGKLKSQAIESVRLEFPFVENLVSEAMSEIKMAHWIALLRERFPTVRILPPLGFSIEQPETMPAAEIFPSPEILITRAGDSGELPLISIVIPAYERAVELVNTLRHIFVQRAERASVEIIVVDRGSSDPTVRDVERLADGDARGFAFKLLRLGKPLRPKPSVTGYRASIARNLGASVARGRWLFFLDDAALVPRNTLAVLLAKASDATSPKKVFVARRFDLRPDIFGVRLSYDNVRLPRDLMFPDCGYLRDFYRRDREWMDVSRPWRFVRSHGMLIERQEYEAVGGFRENFLYSYFADQEFGLRLQGFGLQFEVLPIDVLCQHRVYQESSQKTSALENRGARLLHRYTLSEEIASEFRSYYRFPSPFWRMVDYFKSGGPLWRFRTRPF